MEVYNKNEELFNELIMFIKNQVGVHDKLITRKTLIEDDLGVTGNDAEELLIAFSKRYNVDINSFDFAKYFYGEPGLLDFVVSRKVIPFTVGYLEKAIIVGRLDDEVINS